MNKILVLYAYANYNRGDAAIILGADSLLRRIYPNATIEYANFLWPEHDNAKNAKSFYDEHRIETVDLPNRKLNRFAKLKAVLSKKDSDVVTFLKDNKYDMVLSVGGHFLYSRTGNLRSQLRETLRLWDIYGPLICAKSLGLKTGILCQSIGPINQKLPIISFVLERSDFVITRESNSYREIKTQHKAVTSSCDLAFFINTDVCTSGIHNWIFDKPDCTYVVINMRRVLASGGFEVSNEQSDLQSNFFKHLCNDLLKKTKLKIYLISQVEASSVADPENDSVLHLEFKQKYFNDCKRVEVIEDILQLAELKKIYSNAEAVISTRFHGLIFTLLGGGLPIGINLDGIGHKMSGMFEDLEIEENLCNLKANKIQECCDRILNIVGQKKIITTKKYIELHYDKIQHILAEQ